VGSEKAEDEIRFARIAHQHGLILLPFLSGQPPSPIELALLHLAIDMEPYALAAHA
jgi:hypothetical protein